MNNATPWFASKTIWAGILGAVIPVLGLLLHVTVTGPQLDEIATDVSLIGGAIAGLAAIYGRVKATQTIKGTAASAAILPQAKGS